MYENFTYIILASPKIFQRTKYLYIKEQQQVKNTTFRLKFYSDNYFTSLIRVFTHYIVINTDKSKS